MCYTEIVCFMCFILFLVFGLFCCFVFAVLPIYSNNNIFLKLCQIELRSEIITSMKSHTGFQLEQQSVTSIGLEQPNSLSVSCMSQAYVVTKQLKQESFSFYSAAALHAMQSAVIPTAIPSVCLSVRLSHAGTLEERR